MAKITPPVSNSGEILFKFCGQCGAEMALDKKALGFFWECPKDDLHDRSYVRPLMHGETPFNRNTGKRQ